MLYSSSHAMSPVQSECLVRTNYSVIYLMLDWTWKLCNVVKMSFCFGLMQGALVLSWTLWQQAPSWICQCRLPPHLPLHRLHLLDRGLRQGRQLLDPQSPLRAARSPQTYWSREKVETCFGLIMFIFQRDVYMLHLHLKTVVICMQCLKWTCTSVFLSKTESKFCLLLFSSRGSKGVTAG